MHLTMNYPFLPERSRLQLPGEIRHFDAAAAAAFIRRCAVRGVLIAAVSLLMAAAIILTAWVVSGLLLSLR